MKYNLAIKDLRKKMFVSQEELAEILGVSHITVNRWENEKYEPTIKMKKKLNTLFIEYKIINDQITGEKKHE